MSIKFQGRALSDWPLVEQLNDSDIIHIIQRDEDGSLNNRITTLDKIIFDTPELQQSDWNETDSTKASYIQNKPDIDAITRPNDNYFDVITEYPITSYFIHPTKNLMANIVISTATPTLSYIEDTDSRSTESYGTLYITVDNNTNTNTVITLLSNENYIYLGGATNEITVNANQSIEFAIKAYGFKRYVTVINEEGINLTNYVTQTELTTNLNNYLPLTGGVMTGNINMGSHFIFANPSGQGGVGTTQQKFGQMYAINGYFDNLIPTIETGTVGTTTLPYQNGYFINLYKDGKQVATLDDLTGLEGNFIVNGINENAISITSPQRIEIETGESLIFKSNRTLQFSSENGGIEMSAPNNWILSSRSNTNPNSGGTIDINSVNLNCNATGSIKINNEESVDTSPIDIITNGTLTLTGKSNIHMAVDSGSPFTIEGSNGANINITDEGLISLRSAGMKGIYLETDTLDGKAYYNDNEIATVQDINSFRDEIDSNYLPLTGGTLTGILYTNANILPSVNNTSSLGNNNNRFNAVVARIGVLDNISPLQANQSTSYIGTSTNAFNEGYFTNLYQDGNRVIHNGINSEVGGISAQAERWRFTASDNGYIDLAAREVLLNSNYDVAGIGQGSIVPGANGTFIIDHGRMIKSRLQVTSDITLSEISNVNNETHPYGLYGSTDILFYNTSTNAITITMPVEKVDGSVTLDYFVQSANVVIEAGESVEVSMDAVGTSRKVTFAKLIKQ